jgi:hypothetical protein
VLNIYDGATICNRDTRNSQSHFIAVSGDKAIHSSPTSRAADGQNMEYRVGKKCTRNCRMEEREADGEINGFVEKVHQSPLRAMVNREEPLAMDSTATIPTGAVFVDVETI